jgi:lysophospholipase L1-like esterase
MNGHSRRAALLSIAAMVCALGATCVMTTSAAADGPSRSAMPEVTPGSRYLALGDSVTFGYMEPAVVPAPNYRNASSFIAYPEQLGAGLRLNVANAACPGETSTSLINPAGPSNGCENSPGRPKVAYRRAFPLHVRYAGSQLAYALSYLRAHPDTRLVSLMIGANDLLRCRETTKDGCSGKAEFQSALAKVARTVRRILSAIRHQARYSGQLVVVNYHALSYAVPVIRGQSAALNDAVDGAAQPFRVRFADGFGEWRAAALHSGGDPCKAGLLTQLRTGGCGFHPTYAGQALLAEALLKVVRLIA